MIKSVLSDLKKMAALQVIYSLTYLLLFAINAGGIWFVITLLQNDVSITFFTQIIVLVFGVNILLGVVNDYCNNIAQGHFQKLRQIRYRNFNKVALGHTFASYDDTRFRARFRQAADFLSSNISGFEAVLKGCFNFIPVFIVVIISGILLGYHSIVILIICMVLNVAKYFAILKMRDFEIENILDKGENANKLNYYRNIAIDYQFGKDIRLYNLGNFIIYKYGRVVKNIRTLISTQIKIQNKWGNISALSTLLSDIGFYTITFFLVINNHLEFASLFLLIGLYEVFSHNYRELIEIVANIKKDGELYNIYAEFMNISGITIGTPKSNGDAQHQSVEKCTIEFCNVSFMYPNSDNYILRNINLSVSSDEKIGLIGENGAGKSTIVKLLIGLYTPTSGEILINGIKAEAEELRCLASAVFQESDIFAMTLFENIFPHNSFDEPALGSLLKTFDLEKDFLKNDVITNPMMLKILDEKGFVPSGGVKQKLLFMRALLRLNIKFLVLDEPTSSLDSHSELALYSILGNMPSERGAVIISHRLAITNMVDRVIVLSKGMIVADGTHEKLLRKNEEYRLLYEAGRAMYGSDAGGMPEWN